MKPSNKKHEKENLGDKTSKSFDAIVYIVVAAFYPIFMALSFGASMLSNWSPLKTFFVMTGLYVFFAAIVLFTRWYIVEHLSDLWIPRKISGTIRQDYSILSSMMVQGRYEEAETEALNLYIQDRSPEIGKIMGDFYYKEKRYDDSIRWYQKGMVFAKDGGKLYFLERLIEIGDRHFADNVKVKMYLQKMQRDFPDTEAARYAMKRLKGMG